MMRVYTLALGLFAGVLFVGCTTAPPNAPSPGTTGKVWACIISDWRLAPPGGDLEEAAYATLVRLQDGGRFSMIDCLLRRVDGQLFISVGDGQNIYIGNWVRSVNGLYEISYQLYWRIGPRRIPPEEFPGPVTKAELRIEGNLLRFDERICTLTRPSDVADYDRYVEFAERMGATH